VPVENDVIHSTVAQDLCAADQHATVTATIWKFANAAAQAGIDLETLIAILESGVPMQAVFEIIESGLTSAMVKNSRLKVAD
jgi:hypothetical protein